MSDLENPDEVSHLQDTISEFLKILYDRLGSNGLGKVLEGSETLVSATLRQRPEAFVEDELLWNILSDLGLERDIRPYGEGGGRGEWPDFEITNIDEPVLGEAKSLNDIDKGVSDAKEYLDRKSLGPNFAVATDGFEWVLIKIEQSGDTTNFPEICSFDLRPVFRKIASKRKYVNQASITPIDIESELDEFANLFEREKLEAQIIEAPRILRDRRKRDVEEFYQLYIELLFGESDDYSDDYKTCLLDDIIPPDNIDASEDDKRLFAVNLMNRLLFIKFLEKRNVLKTDDNHVEFLLQRLRSYEKVEDEFSGRFYDTQLKPLFYNLLNTKKSERDPDYDYGWFEKVEYLNGGLFRPNLEGEERYGVLDRTLKKIIRDLIEGSKLELSGDSFDPSLIGSVFEMTINHLNEDSDKSDTGAYYTPNDVTKLITQQSVDPKIKQEVTESFVQELGGDDPEIIRGKLDSQSFEEILRKIEDGEGWYSDPDAIDEALNRISNLTVIDPACGSGHFLTTAMDEIHRVQIALMRGKSGDNPSAAERYEAKKELALNCIYGVDIEKVGVEIAKLRVWLKMVEGNGWSEEFDPLPNIDVNISHGNSLVGFPAVGPVETVDIWSDDIEELDDLREYYKYNLGADETDKEDIDNLARNIRDDKDREFVNNINHNIKTSVSSSDELKSIFESFRDEQTLYPTIDSVKVEREDGEHLTEDNKDELDGLGFNVHSKSARLNVKSREAEIKKYGVGYIREKVESQLIRLIRKDYEFVEVVRKPLKYDLDNINGRPFHWTSEFPELTFEEKDQRKIKFDIIIGNPPYGDLLNNAEEVMMSGYETSNISDISANFVERQLQILDEGGSFGNITTLRLVYQSSLEELYDLIRRKLDDTHIACFGSRPAKVFDNADINVSIFTGKRSDENERIHTSDFMLFAEETRDSVFENIEYSDIDGLVLKDRIGGDEGNRAIIPKIGSDTKHSILKKLRDYDGNINREVYYRKDPDNNRHAIWRREGLRYWTNVMRAEHYKAREVKPIYYDTELNRDAAFIMLNSSLFYTYWMTYGNFHHLNWSQVEAFPFPTQDALEKHEDKITKLSQKIWDEMKDGFDPNLGTTGEFDMQPIKPLIHKVDDILQDIYGLSDEEVEFVKNYCTNIGDAEVRNGPKNEDIRDYLDEIDIDF